MSQLSFNPSANAKHTKAREKQMERALSTVGAFVKGILEGRITTPRLVHSGHAKPAEGAEQPVAAPFWTSVECSGSESGARRSSSITDKTWSQPFSIDDLFATYKAEMLRENASSDLSLAQFCEQMGNFTPPRFDTTRKVAAQAQLNRSECVLVTRGSVGTRPRLHCWPKWSVCCKAFTNVTGIYIEEWSAPAATEEDQSGEGEDQSGEGEAPALEEETEAGTVEDVLARESAAYARFADDMLWLAKPMRHDAKLASPDAQCRQLCTYFGVRMLESSGGGWYRTDDDFDFVLDTALAAANGGKHRAPTTTPDGIDIGLSAAVMAARAAVRARVSRTDAPPFSLADKTLPLLEDYVPEHSFALSSVPPLERLPEPLRQRVRQFANQHGVDVALLLLPDGVWATVQTENPRARHAEAVHQPHVVRVSSNAGTSRFSAQARQPPAQHSSVDESLELTPQSNRLQMARIEECMQSALRVAESLMQPLDIVRRRRTALCDDPVVCVALWGRFGAKSSDPLFIKPLVRNKDCSY